MAGSEKAPYFGQRGGWLVFWLTVSFDKCEVMDLLLTDCD